jgi:hypothetical protein
MVDGVGVPLAMIIAGSGPAWAYPSVTSWAAIIGALTQRFGDVVIFLIGKLRRDDRTSTSVVRADVDRLLAQHPQTVGEARSQGRQRRVLGTEDINYKEPTDASGSTSVTPHAGSLPDRDDAGAPPRRRPTPLPPR